EKWPVEHAAAGDVRGAETWSHGPADRKFGWASVTKVFTALAALVAAEEGVLDLDESAGPPGATVRPLLAHASGLPFDGESPIAPPGRRRIYSNEGFRVLGQHVAARAVMLCAHNVGAAVLEPLDLRLDPGGHPGAGMHGSLADVLAL